jgi:NAD(P)-dependent dehydrogenase (short-subunit alcohol dehydrogenase family)
MVTKWTAADIPDQSGRLAVVTGANIGLGLVTARELARAGATVVLGCRSQIKGERALAAIRQAAPGAKVSLESLDLAALSSVREFAARVGAAHPRLDLLINNAGLMAPPRGTTADGFETQFGTNHLGHFALTGLVLGPLLAAPAPRVVTVSSGLHRMGSLKWGDLQGERRYNRWLAYGQSKLANLLFCFELQRRATAAGSPLKSVAAHPGYADTNLQYARGVKSYQRPLVFINSKLIAQSAEMGTLPTLYAATVPELPGGTFVGPDGFMEGRGYPRVVTAAGKAYDEDAWRRLWDISEELTGVHYEFAALAVS